MTPCEKCNNDKRIRHSNFQEVGDARVSDATAPRIIGSMRTSNTPDATVGERLTAIRSRRGWSQRQLAERSGITPSTISRIEADGTPNPGVDTLQKLADALGEPLEAITGSRMPPPSTVVFGGVAGVPLVQYVAHAGAEQEWLGLGPQEWVPADMERGRRLLAAEVQGRCLAPEIEPGDVVIFDRNLRDPQDGQVVVVTTPSAGVFVKRAYRIDTTVRLLPDDGDVPPGEPVTIEGVAIRVVKALERGKS